MTTLYNGKIKNLKNYQVAVDPEKFRKLLRERGLTQSEVCTKIGYCAHSISGALCEGVFSGPMVAGLKTVLNIDPEEYRYEYVPPKEEPEPEEEVVALEDTALYATMKRAMLDALAETTEFYGKFMHNVIKQAMCEALKG